VAIYNEIYEILYCALMLEAAASMPTETDDRDADKSASPLAKARVLLIAITGLDVIFHVHCF